MALVDIGGIRLNVERLRPAGAGPEPPPVAVCVHGMGLDSLASYYLTLAVPLARAGVEVLMYDLRGHGRSQRPSSGYRLGDFTADLAGLVRHYGYEHREIHLIGNSFGGTVAFSYAAEASHRIATLLAIETEPPTASWARWIADRMRASAELAEAITWERIAVEHGKVVEAQGRAAAELVRTTTLASDVVAGPLLAPEELHSFSCRVFGLYGAESELADRADRLRGQVPGSTTVVVPGYGHSLLVDGHRQVAEHAVRWITEGSATVG